MFGAASAAATFAVGLLGCDDDDDDCDFDQQCYRHYVAQSAARVALRTLA